MFKRTLASLSILAVMAAGGLGVQAAGAAAPEQGRVLMSAPAKNCAVVAEFPGIKNVTTQSYIRK
ncbi:MAG: hypothetical protein H5T99_11955, partial [Moorella sp. (in: Bacteria)]|nr:hypothetical protein [Moorella sp. (in: firmicutes)]